VLKGRGTKDKYTLDEMEKIKHVPDVIRKQNPYGLMTCRSVRKCKYPEKIKRLRFLTNRYDYSERGPSGAWESIK
jgi:hypothetical protein